MKITSLSSLNSKVPEGNSLSQYLATITGTLTIITSGMHYGWPSPSLPALRNSTSFAIDDHQASWISVMPLVGAVVGALLAATVVDALGRKRAILATCFPFFAAWIMIALAPSIAVLYVARFVTGVADGWAFTAVPMYIGEIAEPRIRGLLGSAVSAAWILGILLVNLVGSFLPVASTALLSSALPVVTFLTFVWVPESPYHLVMKGRLAAAKRSLQALRGRDDVDAELNRVSKAVAAQTENTGKFLDLFTTRSNRKAVYVIMVLRGAQQLSGTTAITFYTQDIFRSTEHYVPAHVAAIVYFFVQFLLTILCSNLVDRAGRRPLLVLSMSGSAGAMFLVSAYFFVKQRTAVDVTAFSYLPVVSLIAFVVFFSSGMQSIPILMLGELFPANVKAFALCMADIYFCVVATVVSKFFYLVKNAWGIDVPFYVFTGSCLLGLVLVFLVVPETKGKSLEEIQVLLGGKVERERKDERVEA